jgi:hypothetical protein
MNFFNPKRELKNMDLVNFTPIQKVMKVEGIFIPGIIRNGDCYFFTNLEVYSDGIIEAWGTFDLDFFKRKIDANWIAVSIPDGKNFSIHHVSDFTIRKSSWKFNKVEFYDQIVSLIKEMNPDLSNIFNFHGKDTLQKDGANYSRLPMSQGQPTKPVDERLRHRKSLGEKFTAFMKEKDGVYHLCCVSVFKDGLIRVSGSPFGIDLDLEELKARVDDGMITTELLSGDKVIMYGLGDFEVDTVSYANESKLLISEIEDAISKLNNRPTTSEECRDSYNSYLKDPTIKLRDELKLKYERVPIHLRRYVLGDMDVKDIPIRMIIYGDDEIEQWSHYAAAKEFGHDLPAIEVPKPADK